MARAAQDDFLRDLVATGRNSADDEGQGADGEGGKTFSVAEAASRLGMTDQNLYGLIARGKGPRLATGFSTKRITAADLDAYQPEPTRKGGPGRPRRGKGKRPKRSAPTAPRERPDPARRAVPLDAIDWGVLSDYFPRIKPDLEDAHAWPAGAYLTPVGLLVRLPPQED